MGVPGRLWAFLLAAPHRGAWAPLVVRVALAVVFVPAGLGKFVNHDAYVERFDRWGFPQPGAVAYAVGVLEVVCGLAMLAGFAPRLTGLLLAGNMAGAFLTAGLVDGGMNLWLPPVLLAASVYVAALGPGRLAWDPGAHRAGRGDHPGGRPQD